jgi:hypothetical protein
MIKGLFFTATLLAPGLAYGAGPTATLSDQVVDPAGPPTPPAQATVANFNTCVVCFDFTAASGGVLVNGAAPTGVNAAQPNTWLDCAGASPPIFYHGANAGPVSGPCPTVSADPLGANALKMQLGTTTIPASTDFFNGLENGSGYPPPSTAILVPTNSYTEATYWVSSWPITGNCSAPVYSQGLWEGELDGSPLNNIYNYLEFDAHEINCDPSSPGSYGSGVGSWAVQHAGGPLSWYGTFPPISGYRVDQGYVKVGMRITGDGHSTFYKCMWFNNVLANCINWAPTNANGGYYTWQLSDTSSRMRLLYSPVGIYNSGNGSAQTLPSDMISWTKSINVWSCANWQTTACSTSNPDPGGY